MQELPDRSPRRLCSQGTSTDDVEASLEDTPTDGARLYIQLFLSHEVPKDNEGNERTSMKIPNSLYDTISQSYKFHIDDSSKHSLKMVEDPCGPDSFKHSL